MRRSAKAEPPRLEGEVRWIDRERSILHVQVERAEAGLEDLTGTVASLDLGRARLRVRVTDRNGDRRVSFEDIVLGDHVTAIAARADRAALSGALPIARALVVQR